MRYGVIAVIYFGIVLYLINEVVVGYSRVVVLWLCDVLLYVLYVVYCDVVWFSMCIVYVLCVIVLFCSCVIWAVV